jgi:DHA1 family inner membrane transport protein
MPLGLFALAIGGFGIGLTEFVILGLLPDVADDFGVTESTAGWLISGYALAVAVGAVGLTLAVTRLNRKHVLVGLMVLFIAGNLISAVAPDYATMMLGRIVAALCHGAFFGIGSVVAADMVAPNKRAAAIATMFAGLTIANVLGVPLGTLLGQELGWRSTFWAITVIGVVALAGLAALVPAQASGDEAAEPRSVRGELAVFSNGQVWLSMAVTILGYGGMFGAFTYIAFTVTEVTGFAASAVPWLLILFGVGMFAGNIAGGRAADRSLSATMRAALLALIVVLAFFALTATSRPATIVSILLMGAFGFATVPGLQMRIMRHAATAPVLASGANIAAFNVGNALGAWLGGLTIAAGLGFTAPIWMGAVLTAGGLGVLVVADRLAERRAAGVLLPASGHAH